MNRLSNSGITILNEAASVGEMTIIAIGVPRSGTSMIGSVLHALGVFLGEKADLAVFEDTEIASAMERDDVDSLRALVADRNTRYSIWGFKRPLAYRYLSRFMDVFRNPRIVVTFRDPAAIAKRNEISLSQPFFDVLKEAASATTDLVTNLKGFPCPIMTVSYEKALEDPEHFLSILVGFCGLSPSEEERAQALSVIKNGPDLYLESSRVWYEGAFDEVNKNIARGWVRRMPMKSTCVVEILNGGTRSGVGHAKFTRPDLTTIGAHAFEIHLSESIDPGHVEARVAGTTFILPKTEGFRVS